MRHLFFILLLLFSFSFSFGQDQLRLRGGYAKSFASGKNVGLHSVTSRGAHMASGIGLEYFKPTKERDGYLFGAFMDIQAYMGTTNYRKFPVSPRSFSTKISKGDIKLYGGYERSLSNNPRLNANYFSLHGGVGLGLNGLGGSGGMKVHATEEMGRTLDGDIYGGVYIDEGWWTPGYYISVDVRPANWITPEIFAGLRWNIRNRKTVPVLALEGVVNYSLLTKTYVEFSYTLNGEPKTDRIKDYGLNAQFNLVIPLKTFRKKADE